MAPEPAHVVEDGAPVSKVDEVQTCVSRRSKCLILFHVCKSFQTEWKKYSEYAVNVDPDQDDKSTEIKLCSFARPHMRAFHCSWWGFFV